MLVWLGRSGGDTLDGIGIDVACLRLLTVGAQGKPQRDDDPVMNDGSTISRGSATKSRRTREIVQPRATTTAPRGQVWGVLDRHKHSDCPGSMP